ncbi:hypothetical protein KAR91_06545 [Candidatus Pacearchaeota archaeon]|nr:hypothetical protein [Candidatus Pacearchaeota archaeon]
MESVGKIHPIGKISFYPASREEVRDNIKRWYKEKQKISFVITGEAIIETGNEHGEIFLTTPEGQLAGNDIVLKTWYKRRTLSQLNTLKALESIIYQCDNGVVPVVAENDLWFIHQGIIELAGLTIYNSFTDSYIKLTSSSPMCDTVAMNRFIEIALDELSKRSIPENVRDSLFDQPIKNIFINWYKKRMILDDINHIKNWDSYREMFPWCEFTIKRGTEDAPLIQMHIVSKGSATDLRDEPWNWLHASQHIHKKQHDLGWGPILQDYPHMKGKIDKARAIAKKRELHFEH